MKIKTKLQIGFTLLLLLLVCTTIFGYNRLSRMDQMISALYDNQLRKSDIIVDLRGNVSDSNRMISDLIIGVGDQQSGIEQIMTKLTEASEQFRLLAEAPSTPAERQFIEKIKSGVEQHGSYLRTVARLANDKELSQIRQLYMDEGRAATRQLLGSLNELIEFEQQLTEDSVGTKKRIYQETVQVSAALTVFGILLGVFVLLWVVPGITAGLSELSRMASYFSRGKLNRFARMKIEPKDELGELARLFREIALDLHAKNEREAEINAIFQAQSRKDAQLARVTELLRQAHDMDAMASSFIEEFAPVLGAEYGAVYLADPKSERLVLYPVGMFAGQPESLREASGVRIESGEGLVGQCAKSGAAIVVDDVPEGYVTIASGIGKTNPRQLVLQPVHFDGELLGVIELASMRPFTSDNRELLSSLASQLGMLVHNIRSRQRVEELLQESRIQSEELEAQRNALKSSQHRLQLQQAELEAANQELTAKKYALEEHIRRTESQNRQIAQANAELEQQALQLAITGKYRTEFMANMSHELRTPLNSLLILSEFLAENKEGNLTPEQQEYVRTIRASGEDLFEIIDEILDLSKIDAGKMDLQPEWMAVGDIAAYVEHTYTPVAARRGLDIAVIVEKEVPEAIWTDGHRLKQILRNLFSNAIKFTHEGAVRLRITAPSEEQAASLAERGGGPGIVFHVIDTGIGIAPDKRDQVFEAFRQADGTTSREYGGTGLGLAISRELARLLGGWIELQTEVGRGSTFTLVVPAQCPAMVVPHSAESGPEPEEGAAELTAATIEPDAARSTRELPPAASHPGESAPDALTSADPPAVPSDGPFANKKVLIVDDDVRNLFALSRILEHCRMAVRYAENGIEALRKLEEEGDVDIVLMDIMMPIMDGFETIRRIRANPAWRAIPIIALTAKAMSEDRGKCLEAGASDYLAKPVHAEQLLSVLREWLDR